MTQAPPHDDHQSLEHYYDERFRSGYMQEWPALRQRRITALVQSCGLPARGRALDFGCGQGVFTEILRRALPAWEVVGTDLSPVAIDMARARFAGCRFVAAADAPDLGTFDLVFTHHVLEHVEDLDATLAMLADLVTPDGHMLHVLPCGNSGSFEHVLCHLRTDGIDPANGRFFLDEEGHLRRLTSDQLSSRLARLGFRLVHQSYANHFWGAIDWMSDLEFEDLRHLLNPAAGRDARASKALAGWHRRLLLLRVLKRPPALLFRGRVKHILQRGHLTTRDKLWLIAANPLFVTAFSVRRAVTGKAEAEWDHKRYDTGGSEMYLVLQRGGRT